MLTGHCQKALLSAGYGDAEATLTAHYPNRRYIGTMNRRELVKAIAAHTDQEPRQVEEVMRGFTDVVTAVVSKGEPVSISGFAKFSKAERPARMGRNPATGESIKIKASKKARITPLKGFKDAVMTPSQAPKLAKGIWPPAPAAAAAAPARGRAGTKPGAKQTATASASRTRPAAPATRGKAAAKPAAKPAAKTTRAKAPTRAR